MRGPEWIPKTNRFCAVLVVSILSGIAVQLAAQTGGSSIEFDNPIRDRGKVLQGDIIKEVFAFTNKGNSTLEIFGVEPS